MQEFTPFRLIAGRIYCIPLPQFLSEDGCPKKTVNISSAAFSKTNMLQAPKRPPACDVILIAESSIHLKEVGIKSKNPINTQHRAMCFFLNPLS